MIRPPWSWLLAANKPKTSAQPAAQDAHAVSEGPRDDAVRTAMSKFYDDLETRSQEAREADLFAQLRGLVASAMQNSAHYAQSFKGTDPNSLTGRAALAKLPVLRKSELTELQAASLPFGGVNALPMGQFQRIYQSPGPIYEAVTPEHAGKRLDRFLHAMGVSNKDVIHNCFSYHFTPAGLMFDSAAQAIGALVFPAGIGQTQLQARAAHDLGSTVYVGTPDYLLKIMQEAKEQGLSLKFNKAGVSGGALFPSLREEYRQAGITCTQCYATAEAGLIAYESESQEGMIVDENVILEIVRPGTGDPVAEGEVGEVLVTIMDPHFPLIRLATGDLSAVLAGPSPCGRSNMRIKGWMGRADQAAKVKGMFIRPEQIAQLLKSEPSIARAKAVISRQGENDHLDLLCECEGGDAGALAGAAQAALKLSAEIQIVPVGSLPNDGLVIEDKRDYS